jgi:hypothetical protein
MEREWSGNARRLSRADRAEIERRIFAGETFEVAAAAVGCSTIDSALSRVHRWAQAADKGAVSASPVTCGARGALARTGRRRFAPDDRDTIAASSVDDLARGRMERIARALPSLAIRPRSHQPRASSQAGEARYPLEAVPRSRAWPPRVLVSPADRGPADL